MARKRSAKNDFAKDRELERRIARGGGVQELLDERNQKSRRRVEHQLVESVNKAIGALIASGGKLVPLDQLSREATPTQQATKDVRLLGPTLQARYQRAVEERLEATRRYNTREGYIKAGIIRTKVSLGTRTARIMMIALGLDYLPEQEDRHAVLAHQRSLTQGRRPIDPQVPGAK